MMDNNYHNGKEFCPFYTNCVYGKVCDRAMTSDHRDAALDSGTYMNHYIFEPSCFVHIYYGAE